MVRYDSKFCKVDCWWPWEGDYVQGFYEEFNYDFERIVYKRFPSKLLTFSDDELRRYVDELIVGEKKKELEAKAKQEALERERDLLEYNRLKEKLGL